MPESSLIVPEVYFQAQIDLFSSLHTEGERSPFLPTLLPAVVCVWGGGGGAEEGLGCSLDLLTASTP